MVKAELVPLDHVERVVRLGRSHNVLLDADLAAFYGETTKRFNQQVKRNLARFPADFMFQLDQEEFAGLRLQIATLKTGQGQHRKYAPYVFTEHGAIMAANVLNSPYAVQPGLFMNAVARRSRPKPAGASHK